MLLQSPLVTESFVLPAEPTEVLDLGGVGGAVLQSHVALYLSVPAAQTVPAALETGHGRQALRDDDQRLRLPGAHPVLLLHVSHGLGLEGENLQAVPALEGVSQVVLHHMRLQNFLVQ